MLIISLALNVFTALPVSGNALNRCTLIAPICQSIRCKNTRLISDKLRNGFGIICDDTLLRCKAKSAVAGHNLVDNVRDVIGLRRNINASAPQ